MTRDSEARRDVTREPEAPGEGGRAGRDSGVALARLIDQALAEDLGAEGDVTSRLTVPEDTPARADFVSREDGVLFGAAVAAQVFRTLDPGVAVTFLVPDGGSVRAGERIGTVAGRARTLLAGERTALNFLQRLSGIATRTRRFVDRLEGTGVRVLDTRKTTPGWREIEKAAVRAGGGHNHRHGLNDMILIKDNHIVAAGGITPALAAARAGRPEGMKIEVEVARLSDLDAALAGRPDGILLDNMTPGEVRTAVARVGREAKPPWVEVSGGVTLETARDYALPGVTFLSSGSLTHSAPALDIALEFTEGP